jgi:hypothetical protein
MESKRETAENTECCGVETTNSIKTKHFFVNKTKESPNHNDESPNHNDESPNHNDESPDHNDESPDHNDER